MNSKQAYKTIELREFRCTLPLHVLNRLPNEERAICEGMSRIENRCDWLSEGVFKNNMEIQLLDERISELASSNEKLEARCQALTLELTSANAQLAALTATTKESASTLKTLWDWKTAFNGKWGILAAIGIAVLSGGIKVMFDFVLALSKTVK